MSTESNEAKRERLMRELAELDQQEMEHVEEVLDEAVAEVEPVAERHENAAGELAEGARDEVEAAAEAAAEHVEEETGIPAEVVVPEIIDRATQDNEGEAGENVTSDEPEAVAVVVVEDIPIEPDESPTDDHWYYKSRWPFNRNR